MYLLLVDPHKYSNFLCNSDFRRKKILFALKIILHKSGPCFTLPDTSSNWSKLATVYWYLSMGLKLWWSLLNLYVLGVPNGKLYYKSLPNKMLTILVFSQFVWMYVYYFICNFCLSVCFVCLMLCFAPFWKHYHRLVFSKPFLKRKVKNWAL